MLLIFVHEMGHYLAARKRGVPLLAALFFYRPSPMLVLIAVLAYPQIKAALSGKHAQPPEYFQVPQEARINYAVMYLGLAAFLAIMSYELHGMIGR